MSIIKLHPDGTSELSDPDTPPTLTEMQEFVGGYIEEIPVHGQQYRALLFVNEDGRRLELEYNPLATVVARVGILGPAMLVTDRQLDAMTGPKEE